MHVQIYPLGDANVALSDLKSRTPVWRSRTGAVIATSSRNCGCVSEGKRRHDLDWRVHRVGDETAFVGLRHELGVPVPRLLLPRA